MKPSIVLLAAALSGALAACGGGGEGGSPVAVSGSSSSRPTEAAEPSASSASPVPALSPRPSATAAAAAPEGEAPVPFPADTEVDVAKPSGGPLSVRAVRVARQQGYDRVVFELAGRNPGQAGWRVEYVDEPSQQGSGDPVEVEGEAVLAVLISGTGYPMDTGVEEVTEDPALPAGPGVVSDVVLGAVFEGQYEAFIGTTARSPFRVHRLGDPERVVVDIRTP